MSHIKILELVLFYLKFDKLTADTGEWHKFVKYAKELFPEKFKYTIFDVSDPEKPFSDEADHVLHVFTQAGVLLNCIHYLEINRHLDEYIDDTLDEKLVNQLVEYAETNMEYK